MAFKKGNIPWNKGLKYDQNILNKLDLEGLEKGRGFWKGKKFSDSYKEKLSKAHIGIQTNERHPLWQGDKVSYRSLHKWVNNKLGKALFCQNDITHKFSRYHWANISKEYRRDLMDWKQLCPSCNAKDRIGRRVSP